MTDRDNYKTLWMGDLEPYMDDFFILQAFEQMGEPAQSVKLILNKITGLPAGYCFIDFVDRESAQRAMHRLNGKIIPNSQPPHRFKLNCNTPKDNPKKEFSLFVGELTEEVDDYILFQAFSKKYPSCHAGKVVLDNRGVSKGYGFVRFSEETDQQKALIEMQHLTGIGRKPIRVSLATPKGSRFGDRQQPPPPPSHSQYHNQQYYNQYNKMYEDYSAYYQQYYANYYASQHQQQQQPATNYYQAEDDPTALEEPELEIDVDKYNKEYMAQSEEIFDLLEDSRWHPMDQWNSTVPATAR